MSIGVSAFTLTTALGSGNSANLEALKNGCSGLRPITFDGVQTLSTYTGEVHELDDLELAGELASWHCRNNCLAKLAVEQDGFLNKVQDLVGQYGADRVGLIVGTSTSGIRETELAYRSAASKEGFSPLPDWYCYETTHNIHSVSAFLKSLLGIRGYCITISTACSSSARVFTSAVRALESNVCDAVVVGGVDSLCETTLHGFHSLQLTSERPCRPCDQSRNGISIGEAGGFALLTKDDNDIVLLGGGESADAHHMSSPHPEGRGAMLCMQSALNSANLSPEQIDYINLHGTGTRTNDTIECLAISKVFGNEVPCSSTKGFTGHTLGACGIVETIFSLFALRHQFLPANLNLERVDSVIRSNVTHGANQATVRIALSNSFGFGGNNCSLIFGVQ